MPRIRPRIVMIPVALLAAIILWPRSVSAQCGTQASSCKNCHEVQGQDPVNTNGAWHIDHAFGDFCEFCHAGNVTATDKDAAHAGMVDPMADVNASCQQCHAGNLQKEAETYAVTLGIDLGAGEGGASSGSQTSAGSTGSSAPATATPVAITVPVSNQPVVDDPNVTDYVERYDEIVLGKRPVNWGNVVLIVLIGMIVVGGGGFVIVNEKLVKVSFGDTRAVGDEYPAEVVDMLPALNGLRPKARKSLKHILSHSGRADRVLELIDEVVTDDGAGEQPQ